MDFMDPEKLQRFPNRKVLFLFVLLGRKADRTDRLPVAPERPQRLPGGRVPDPRGAVVGARHDPHPVAGELSRGHRVTMATWASRGDRGHFG